MNSDAFSFDQEIDLFLATCRTASLATVGRLGGDAGQPHAANVQYAHDASWCLYWISSPDSAHSQHLAAHPRAAVTVYAHQDVPELIHGLQMHGTVDLVIEHGQAEWHRVWELYTRKYDFVRSVPQLREAAEKQKFYCFRPTWVRWIDNRKGFGWKIEKDLAMAEPSD
ncbi:MAG: pyridoxamine 5'-phosphate oxidase family protein [Planctomycetota bacterium]